MYQRIAHVSLLVQDYDEAIDFYTQKLGFRLLEDTPLDQTKRWVVIAPPGAAETSLVLAKVADSAQMEWVGNQAGGRVAFFLFTDNFLRDYETFQLRGVTFVRPPETYDYGTVAVFQDLYGNLWDLIEPSPGNKGLLSAANIKRPGDPPR